MSSYRERLERLANQTFAEFQAEVRAGERVCAEADLYWRANRWAVDGYGFGAASMKVGPINVFASGSGGRSTFLESVYRDDVIHVHTEMSAAEAERYRSLYQCNKPAAPGTGRIFRR